MTDLPLHTGTLPGQLGATARLADGELLLELEPHPAVLHHGVVRASVLSYLVDCVAGISLDRDSDDWTLTTDMTVRARPLPAPARVTARFRLLRQGGRSFTGTVDLRADDGDLIGIGAIGFARVRHREGDPPKLHLSVEDIIARFSSLPVLSQPLRDAAGIKVVDGASGVVEVPVTDAIRNTAGTLQGAMAALVAEAAAEDVIAARSGRPVLVTDLDIRFLDKTRDGPIRTRAEALGDEPDAPVVVELVDLSIDTVTTLAHLRGGPPPLLATVTGEDPHSPTQEWLMDP